MGVQLPESTLSSPPQLPAEANSNSISIQRQLFVPPKLENKLIVSSCKFSGKAICMVNFSLAVHKPSLCL